MVPLRRSFRPRLTIIKRTEIDGHAIGQLPAKIEDHGFTSLTILGNIDFPLLSIIRAADHKSPVR